MAFWHGKGEFEHKIFEKLKCPGRGGGGGSQGEGYGRFDLTGTLYTEQTTADLQQMLFYFR